MRSLASLPHLRMMMKERKEKGAAATTDVVDDDDDEARFQTNRQQRLTHSLTCTTLTESAL